MHILLTNDDGPPSPHSSPYVHSLIHHLQQAGHVVSVCLPHTQRSWIGKAHMIGQTVKPLYYRPSTEGLFGTEGTTSTRPSGNGAEDEWILVDGTPASCVQIGLHHFFQERGPIDLVLSGPNYGRNTTAVFALSSGTLGGALEAAVCKRKAIALSYAFFSRNHDPVIIEGAARHSVKVVEKLYQQWPAGDEVDLYSVNVPLVEGVETHKTYFTDMLQNYWRDGSCFQEVDGDAGDEDEEEQKIREGAGGEAQGGETKKSESGGAGGHKHKHFKWAPRFTDVYQSVEEAPPGNDGWAVKEGYTSVTPLKANFWHAAEQLHQKELILDNHQTEGSAKEQAAPSTDLPVRNATAVSEHSTTVVSNPKFHAVIKYEDPYVQPLILKAMERLFPGAYSLLPAPPESADAEPALGAALPTPDTNILHIAPYESLDFDHVALHPSTALVNSYVIRKALIRKHYLSSTVDHWVAKHPDSSLKTHVKRGEHFEVDYAEFLDDALVEAFDLRESMDRNESIGEEDKREWWILKPGMSDRGQGIRLFSSMEELQGVFDEWEEERPDSDDEAEGEEAAATDEGANGGDYITTSHLRHFIAQPYIHPPLLLPGDARKFHIRTYVLCVGSLDVYVYRPMLALFAGKAYRAPWEDADLDGHLTNTCLQGGQEDPSLPPVKQFWDLVSSGVLPAETAEGVFGRICDVTGEIFEAAAREMTIHFQPLGNAFEVFGLDFLVDVEARPWLLEVNSFPDFKQTGGDMKGVVAGFWEETLRTAVGGFFGVEAEGKASGDMVRVRRVELGRR
ncbi:5'/3'-nucleotidase sure [Colletotrichum cereale]|nr:5'/3'-nucleotidase sure [Colletotrichum cereale]